MSLGRLQTAAFAALAVAMAGTLVTTCVSPHFALVRQDREAAWIASPEPPVSTGVVAAPRDALHRVEFETHVRAAGDGPVRVRVEALRGFELEWNGRVLARRAWDEGSWRRPTELTVPARAGDNSLRVRVRNPQGPPLLRLEAHGDGVALRSDERWLARRDGGAPLPARIADDRRRAAATLGSPRLAQSLAERGGALLGLAAACALGAALVERSLRARPGTTRRVLAHAAWAAVALVWIALAWRSGSLPAWVGFDGPDHLAYVHWILERGALPLAGDGPQTHHPPLFYALSAALLRVLPGPEARVLRVLPLLSGLVQVAVALALARRLFPRSPTTATLAALGAALLPLNLTMSAYLGNEPLHAALAALALWATVDLLLREDASPPRLVLLGSLLGLAVLAKVSSLLLVPIAVAAVAARRQVVDGRGPADAALRGAAVAVSAAAVAGWYFVRNRVELGAWLVGNWNVPGSAIAWWQHPGFHTPAYYLRFGGVFGRPFFASFDSFADGIYSTLWGDGLCGGVSAWAHRPPLWNYDWVAVGYLLALPATAMALHGFASLARASLRGDDARRRLALSFLVASAAVTLFATLAITLEVPAYSMTKASYALSMTAPFTLAWARGFRLWRRAAGAHPPLRIALDAWAATFAGAIALSVLSGG